MGVSIGYWGQQPIKAGGVVMVSGLIGPLYGVYANHNGTYTVPGPWQESRDGMLGQSMAVPIQTDGTMP